jgi:hypothetical protein
MTDFENTDEVPAEPSAYDLLGPWSDAALKLAQQHIRVWRWRTRSCKTCGQDFRGPAWTTVRCERCRGRRPPR